MERRKLSSKFSILAAMGLGAAALVAACSGAGDTGATNSAGSGGSTSVGSNSGATGIGGDNGVGSLAGPGSGGSGSGQGGGCAGTSSKAEAIPLDIYIMLDQSGSMSSLVTGTNLSKWTVVTDALKTFVNQPTLNGVGVGIQYFPLVPATCNVADYAKPDVPIAPLPGVVPALTSSISVHGPTGLTPTWPALDGAIQYAKAWQVANPTHVTIVVLATDGLPTSCNSTIANTQMVAAAGFSGMPSIPTYVIGVGSALSNLDAIAMSGGTMSAFLVDTNANAGQAFLDAMNKIRGSVLACTYLLPPPPAGMMLDYTKVNVEYTPGGGGKPITIPKVMDLAACPSPGLGWYYDNNAKPTQIILCPDTCTQISMDAKASINVVLGCGTVIK